MLKKLVIVIKEYASDTLLALMVTMNWLLHLRHFYFLIPCGNCWVVRVKRKWLLVPPRYTGQSMEPRVLLKKYFLSPNIIVEEGDVVFDVGAFIGGFTLAIVYKARRIIAIEPDPLNYLLLKWNTKEARNITLVKKAASNCNAEVLLYQTDDPTSSSLIKPTKIKKYTVVKASRLDTLMSELGVERIDFLKIDAEGAEPEVLEGADLTRVKKVAVDCSPERLGKPTVSEVLKILSSAGFRCQIKGYMIYAYKC